VKNASIKPFLKWAGGKRWFGEEYGDDLRAEIVARGGRYIEPFLGGGAVALRLGLPNMLLGDAEQELIDCWNAVRVYPDAVAKHLDDLRGATSETDYYTVRDLDPDLLSPTERSARTIYLNKMGFNGLFRKNRSGAFNVPWGKGEKRLLPTRDGLCSIARALFANQHDAEIVCGDFEKLINRATGSDLVYCDPPYDGVFTDYTAKGFSADDQDRLAAALWRATTRGAAIVAHNADTPLVRRIYHWAQIHSIEERRAINSNGNGRGAVPCVVITAGLSEPGKPPYTAGKASVSAPGTLNHG
jgi:DNA adenine methylase